jgi:hypothetical protein
MQSEMAHGDSRIARRERRRNAIAHCGQCGTVSFSGRPFPFPFPGQQGRVYGNSFWSVN